MHPFLPVLSTLFLLFADGAMVFLRLNATNPEVALHASSIYTVVVMSVVIGAGLALWLRRFGVLYPGWIAILSLLGLAVLGFSGT